MSNVIPLRPIDDLTPRALVDYVLEPASENVRRLRAASVVGFSIAAADHVWGRERTIRRLEEILAGLRA